MGKTRVVFAVVLGLSAFGCESDDAESLARVARCAAAKGEALAAETGGWQAFQANLSELPLEARVAARLRWDKAMDGAQIQVTASDDHIELKGNVRDEEQRRRALELTESTIGVGTVAATIETLTP